MMHQAVTKQCVVCGYSCVTALVFTGSAWASKWRRRFKVAKTNVHFAKKPIPPHYPSK